MNRIYKSFFNKKNGKFVVASELTTVSKKGKVAAVILAGAIGTLALPEFSIAAQSFQPSSLSDPFNSLVKTSMFSADALEDERAVGSLTQASADSVDVPSGHEKVFIGIERVDENTWSSDSAKLLPDAADGGTVTVQTGGKLTFGADGSTNQTAGWVQNVENNGKLTVRSGEYGIKGTYQSSGVTDVSAGSSLNVNSFNANNGSKTTVTSSKLEVGDLSVREQAEFSLSVGSEFTASGKSEVYGSYKILDNSKGNFAELLIYSTGAVTLGGITDGGSIVNSGSLTFLGDSHWEIARLNSLVTNEQTSLLKVDRNIEVAGKFENNGGVKVGFYNIDQWTGSFDVVGGVFTNNKSGELIVTSDWGAGSVDSGGKVHNYGYIEIDAPYYQVDNYDGEENVSSEFINYGTFIHDQLTVGAAGVLINYGEEKGSIMVSNSYGGSSDPVWKNYGTLSGNAILYTENNINDGAILGSLLVLNGSLVGTGYVEGGRENYDRVQNNGYISQNHITTGYFNNMGKVVVEGQIEASTLHNNGGDISVGTVTNFDKENHYVHEGSAKLEIRDGSIFTGTNLVFAGGGNIYITETDGNPPNFSGLDNSLGENAVQIWGEASYRTDGDHTVLYPEGTTNVFVDRLGSETDLTLHIGGRLVAHTIDFDGTEKTVHFAGGALSTSLSQLFEKVENRIVRIDADSPSDTVDINSKILGVESIGDLKDSIVAGIEFGDGALGVTDQAVSTGTVTAVVKAVAEAAGDSADKVDVVFEGEIFGDDGIVGDLTLDDVADLFREQQGIEGSLVINPGVVLTSTSLDARSDTDGIVTVGGDNADIAGSIGFESIKHADGVLVNEGRETLIGGVLDADKTGGNFDWSDDNRLIESDTAGSGGTVTVEESGRYDFGSKGTEEKHTGWVDVVQNDGTFNVTNGEYGIKGDLVTNVNGESTVQGDAVLHVGGINAEGNVTNDGKITLDGPGGSQSFVVAEDGSFNQNGTLETHGKDAQIAGSLTTSNGAGTDDQGSFWNDMTVSEGGSNHVADGGREEGNTLDLTAGGEYAVEDGGEAHWKQILIGKNEDHPEGGGSFTNDGDVTVDKVVVNEGGSFDNNGNVDGGELNVGDGAVVNIGGGNTDFDKTVIGQNGWLVVGNGETPSADGKAVYDFNSADPVEGDVFVINNGELVFSGEGVDEAFDDLIKAPQLPDAPVKVVVGGTVHVGTKGSLNIGNSSYTKPSADAEEGDRGTANVATGTGNLFFGSDSTTVISVPGVGKGPAFTTDSTSATVTVEDGATLILGNVSEAGQYLITDGFLTQDGSLVEGWLDEEHLYALNDDGTGLNWVLDLGHDSDSIWVDVSYSDIRTEYPDMVLPDNVNDNLQHGSDPRGPQDTFINEILKDKTIGVDEKTRIVNSVAQIAAAGGVFGSGFDNMTAAVDALESRVSFAGETFTHDGRMVTGESGTDLWAVVLGGTHSVDSNTAAGRMSGGYDADTYGIMAGLDHKIRGTNWRTGVALSYQEGDLDSTGDWVDTQTDYDTFGIQAYANYSPNQHFNLIGSVGYFRNGAETTMGLPAASKTFRKASADVDMDMFAAAVRMEGRFDVGSVSVIPHAGVRMLVTNAGQYSTKLDGQTAFESDADSLTTGQLPIGVAVRGDFTGSNGWTWRPTADVTVMPQFGDVDALTHVRGADTGITESLKAEMTGHFVATGSLGLQAEKGNLAIGVGYGYTGGMSGQSDHSFNANVRWRF